jgi:alpha-tubulin suppressor-like RCC1 family protein
VTALGAQVAAEEWYLQANSSLPMLGVGTTHTCAIMGDAHLWCWGHNEYGQLGDGTTTNRALPVQVNGLSLVTAVAVSAKGQFTCAMDRSLNAYCWGRNDHGQLGDGTTVSRSTAAPVLGGMQTLDIVAGTNHACLAAAQSSSTAWYCWGGNEHGQLGDGTTTDRLAPIHTGPGVPLPQTLVPATGNTAVRWLAAAALAVAGAARFSSRRRRAASDPLTR